MWNREAILYALALVLLVTAGCGDDSAHDHDDHDHDHAHSDEDPAEEACEHLESGPFEAATAATEAEDAPVAATEHASNDVTLPGGDDAVGYVSFPSPGAATYAFYLTADVPLGVTDTGGTALPVMTSDGPWPCAAIVAERRVTLDVGLHTLTFGPGADEIRYVFEVIDP